MAQVVITPQGDRVYVRRTERRTPHFRLARLNQEFRTDIARLKKTRVVENGLAVAGMASVVLVLAFLLSVAPRCTGSISTPTILIGGAIKVAGC